MPDDGQQDSQDQHDQAGDGQDAAGSGSKSYAQADVDRIVKERLTRERTRIAEQYKDYGDLKAKAGQFAALEEASRTEQEKAVAKAASEAEDRVRAEMTPQLARLQAAISSGLPDDMAKKLLSASKRLVGSTPDELAADAKEFFAAAPIVPTTRRPEPDRSQGRGGGKQVNDMNAFIRQHAGHGDQ